MPFVRELLKYKSVAVVGMEKNCGKTECLNYILRRLPQDSPMTCVTSIGVDGEGIDNVTNTRKPSITLRKNICFATSESHYRNRKLVSEIIGISEEGSALGRIITAKTVSEGDIILSGPSSTGSLKRWMQEAEQYGIELTLIDGALSRMSSASPAISDAMILATGAALSSNPATLVNLTAFRVEMIRLPVIDGIFPEQKTVQLSSLDQVITVPDNCEAVEIKGAFTDRLMTKLLQSSNVGKYKVVVKDFSKIFIDPMNYRKFTKAGGRIAQMKSSRLLAVCINPTSPEGYRLDSDKLCEELSDRIQLPVYDIIKNNYLDKL